MQRYPTKQIKIRDVKIGGDAPISVQSMTFSKTKDVKATLEQIQRLYFAGCDIVRCAVFDKEDTAALREVVRASPLPVVADIHFNHNYAVIVSEFVDAIRINPGNIGSKKKHQSRRGRVQAAKSAYPYRRKLWLARKAV